MGKVEFGGIVSTPFSKATEEALRFKAAELPGEDGTGAVRDVVVVSGYAFYAEKILNGSKKDDETTKVYLVQLVIGPQWRIIRDVSPSVNITGMSNWEPDEVDQQSYGINSCVVQVQGSGGTGKVASFRIRLAAEVYTAGGVDTAIRALSYHVVATGSLIPGQKDYFKEFSKPFS